MIATTTDGEAVGYAQFGPLSVYPRAQVIRDRYPELPDSPAPWVMTCLQVPADAPDRSDIGQALLEAVCAELDRRGVTAIEVYSGAGSRSVGPARRACLRSTKPPGSRGPPATTGSRSTGAS